MKLLNESSRRHEEIANMVREAVQKGVVEGAESTPSSKSWRDVAAGGATAGSAGAPPKVVKAKKPSTPSAPAQSTTAAASTVTLDGGLKACGACGLKPHAGRACPEWVRTAKCYSCKGVGHLAALCPSRGRTANPAAPAAANKTTAPTGGTKAEKAAEAAKAAEKAKAAEVAKSKAAKVAKEKEAAKAKADAEAKAAEAKAA
jgi:hypothetical protein